MTNTSMKYNRHMNALRLTGIAVCIVLLFASIYYWKCVRVLLRDELLEPQGLHPKTWVCLTTVPERLRSSYFLHTINNLSTIAAHVFLSVPKTYARTHENYVVPQSLWDMHNNRKHPLHIMRLETDYGPYTKLYGPLTSNVIPNNHALIICDDDIWYKDTFVRHLQKSYLHHPNSINTYCTEAIEGFAGFMVRKSLMLPILDLENPASCFRIDDDFIALANKHLKIPVSVVDGHHGDPFCSQHISAPSHVNRPDDFYQMHKVDGNRWTMKRQCNRDFYNANPAVLEKPPVSTTSTWVCITTTPWRAKEHSELFPYSYLLSFVKHLASMSPHILLTIPARNPDSDDKFEIHDQLVEMATNPTHPLHIKQLEVDCDRWSYVYGPLLSESVHDDDLIIACHDDAWYEDTFVETMQFSSLLHENAAVVYHHDDDGPISSFGIHKRNLRPLLNVLPEFTDTTDLLKTVAQHTGIPIIRIDSVRPHESDE